MPPENDASTFMDDPIGYFADSVTKMHSISCSATQEVHNEAVNFMRGFEA
jgi:hypothetical protein